MYSSMSTLQWGRVGHSTVVAPRFFFRVAHVNSLRIIIIIIMNRRAYIKTSLEYARAMH